MTARHDQVAREMHEAEALLEHANREIRRRQMQPKLKCPNAKCDGYTSHVVRCRISRDGTVMRRRRECDTCHARFNTTERAEQSA
jgi:hypothetical protein